MTTYTQFVAAPSLRADARNARTIYDSFNRDRGPIIVAGNPIALSEKVDDDYGYQRKYTAGELYAPITGYFSIVGNATGIEGKENAVLQGTSDALFFSRIQDLFTGVEPTGGAVELTINPAAQQAAWDALGDQRGAVVAVDPSNGEILALVSKPSFDPNLLAAHDTKAVDAAHKELEERPDKPLYNRAIAGNLYAPGSTFKLIVAAAALESGQYTKDSVLPAPSTYPLPGSSAHINNSGDSSCAPQGEMALGDALRISCNTAFAGLGVQLGAEALADQTQKFGFGKPIEIPLKSLPSTFPENMDKAQTAQASIGQFDDRVTPLQMSLVAAAIANNGSIMKPHLVRTERDADLKVISTTPVTQMSQAVSQETAAQMHEMMVSVVTAGTGKQAAVDGVTVGGKTGTAEKAPGQAPDVWMVAFGEANGKSVAVAVVVEDGGNQGARGGGGTVAAPIASQVIKAVMSS
jgi:peptidoglycan glycosyltransferase